MTNRIIKFRAWDKEKECWSKIKEWSATGVNATIHDEREKPDLELHNDEWYQWVQFTGLLDKNGKEIYEGDILEDKDGIWKIEWEHAYYRIVNNDGITSDSPSHFFLERAEVIGNIYENKELLK